MLFSKFLKRGGDSVLIDAKSVVNTYSTDITLDVDNGDNVFVLKPTAASIVTVPLPTSTNTTRVLIANQGDVETSAIINGSEYIVMVDEMLFLDWNGSVWVVSGGSILAQAEPLMEYKMLASDGAVGDQYGFSVSMSGDGTRCVAGAWLAAGTNGAVYVYLWDGTSWIEEQKLVAPNGDPYDYFGYYNVAISNDGSRIIVGASADDDLFSNTGAAYIFSRSGTIWTMEQKLLPSNYNSSDNFGFSVDITDDGDRVIVGARDNDEGVTLSNSHVGAAFIFSRSGTTWTEEQMIRNADEGQSQEFGIAVSISGDGSRCVVGSTHSYLVVGNTYYKDGAAYVFTRSGTTWTEEYTLVPSDADNGFMFGYSVSISGDGTRCIVGCVGEHAAYIFVRVGTVWTEEQKLVNATPSTYATSFGMIARISDDGARVIVADERDGDLTNSTQNSGRVFVFDREGTTWTQTNELIASDAKGFDTMGRYLGISADGVRCIAGAYGDDTNGSKAGAAYIFHNI